MLISCNDKNNKDDKKKDVKIPIEIAVVGKGMISAYYSSTASLYTEKNAKIVAKASGYVDKILVDEGDKVKKGQLLAVLENERQILDLKAAKIELDKSEKDFKRAEKSYKKTFISDEAFENYLYKFRTAENRYKQLLWAKNNTEIRSSIDGIISKRDIFLGNMITNGAKAFEVEDFDELCLDVDIPELELHKIGKGLEAKVSFDAVPSRSFKGEIVRINPVIDPTSGTSRAKIRVFDNLNLLKPGMFARVKIEHDRHEDTMLIPKSALLAEDEERAVFVVKDSLVFKHSVKTGYTNSERVEILSGIKTGDSIVTIGVGSLKDSTKVEVIRNIGDSAMLLDF